MLDVLLLLFVISLLLNLWVMFLASFQLFLSASRVSHILIPPYNLGISLVSSLSASRI